MNMENAVKHIKKTSILPCLLLCALCDMSCFPSSTRNPTSTPEPPFVLAGSISWPKALGHPRLTSAETRAIAIGGQQVTYCKGFSIRAWHIGPPFVPPPPGAPKPGLPFEDTNTPGVTLTCRQKPEDDQNYNLEYEIAYNRSLIIAPQCKYVSVTQVSSEVRQWTSDGPLVFQSGDSDANCDKPSFFPPRSTNLIRSQPGEVLDPSKLFGGGGIANFSGAPPG
jgi:hypothetical protein